MIVAGMHELLKAPLKQQCNNLRGARLDKVLEERASFDAAVARAQYDCRQCRDCSQAVSSGNDASALSWPAVAERHECYFIAWPICADAGAWHNAMSEVASRSDRAMGTHMKTKRKLTAIYDITQNLTP